MKKLLVILGVAASTLTFAGGNIIIYQGQGGLNPCGGVDIDSQSLYRDGDSIGITRGNKVYAPISGGSGWSLTGNSINSSDFVGTVNDEDLVLKRNGTESARLGLDNTKFGVASTIAGSSLYRSSVYGNGALVRNNSEYSIAIGEVSAVRDNSGHSIAIGAGDYVGDNCPSSLAVGGIVHNGSFSSIAIGEGSLVDESSPNSIIIGIASKTSTFFGAFPSSNCIGIGNNITMSGDNITAIGLGINANQSNSIILGSNQKVGINTTAPNASLHIATIGSSLTPILLEGMPAFADDAAAGAAGLTTGMEYQTDGTGALTVAGILMIKQ